VGVGCPAEQPPAEVGKPAMHGERVRRVAVSYVLPLLGAAGRIDGVGDRVSSEVQHAVDHDRPGLERRHLGQHVAADFHQLSHSGTRDLGQWGKAIPSNRSVVGGPVPRRNTILCG
jgi:hypothetical protein